MYNPYEIYAWPYGLDNMCEACREYPCYYCVNAPMYYQDYYRQSTNHNVPFTNEVENGYRYDLLESEGDNNLIELKDYGPEPFVVNINEASKQNDTFRTALWTGSHLQVTLMSINVGEDIGLEVHPHLDQFIRIEEGQGIVKMGDRRDSLNFEKEVYDDFAFVIPAGKWHNLVNTGNIPIKLYSIYAPPQHPFGTVHETKADAMAAE